jgi:hypothetical protein
MGMTRRDRIVVVGVLAFCAAPLALGLAVVQMLSNFNWQFPLLGSSGATRRELAMAATTVPPTPDACRAFHEVKSIAVGTARVDLDFALAQRDFQQYRAELTLLLVAFHRDLTTAVAGAAGPMRTHLLATRRSVDAGLADLRAARFTDDYDPTQYSATGWSELQIAQQLLGETCGGGLAPSFDAVSGFFSFAPVTTTTTSTASTTASAG